MNDDIIKFLKDKILQWLLVWLSSIASGLLAILTIFVQQLFPKLSLETINNLILLRIILGISALSLGLFAYIIYLRIKLKPKYKFWPDLGVNQDLKTGHYVCPKCDHFCRIDKDGLRCVKCDNFVPVNVADAITKHIQFLKRFSNIP